MKLDVYDTDATTLLGTLSEAFAVSGMDQLDALGTATFKVDIASSADLDLLLGASRDQTRRVVRFRRGASAGTDDIGLAVLVQDVPASSEDIEPESGRTVTTVTFQCPDLLAWLGYREGGAVLEPRDGTSGRQQNPRWFGPRGWDFPDTAASEPTTDGGLTREGWRDDLAERFVFDSTATYRRKLTGDADRSGNRSSMILTASAWTKVEVYFDGAKVSQLSSPEGSQRIHEYELTYDGNDHVIAFVCEGSPPSGEKNAVGWSWATFTEDAEENRVYTALFRTYNSTTFDGPVAPTEPHWQAWEDQTPPGVTIGYVVDTVAVTEAQSRGEIPDLSTDFDADNDSDGTSWADELNRGFRVDKLGQVVDSLGDYGCEPNMKPDGTLQLFQSRGTDRTGSVTVTSPFSLELSGRGVQATRLLYETSGGFGRAKNESAETNLGVVLADVAQFGEDDDPDQLTSMLSDRLDEDAQVFNEVDVELPDDVVPYTDVFLGDQVNCESSLDGTKGAVRLTSFAFSIDDANGHVNWSATAEPV